jgi:hypothetical protein
MHFTLVSVLLAAVAVNAAPLVLPVYLASEAPSVADSSSPVAHYTDDAVINNDEL